jgi:hypothetical protein
VPTVDRVLVEIVTAANMTGINQAQAGFLKMNSGLLAITAGLGLAVVAGKSAIDITEKHDKALNDLSQAVDAYNSKAGLSTTIGGASAAELAKLTDAQGKAQDSLKISTNALTIAQLGYSDAVKKHGVHSEQARIALLHLDDANIRYKQSADAAADATQQLTTAQADQGVVVTGGAINMEGYRKQIDAFISSNRAYISDQSEVIDSYAKLTRIGLPLVEIQKDMNRALDLSALKGISVAEATDLIIKAESGRFKGLIDLGISTGKYTDAQGNLINGTKDVGRAMAELDPKIDHGRETLTKTSQATNKLSNDWQDIATIAGPPLLGMISGIADAGDWLVRKLKELGDNKDWNNALSAGFGMVQRAIEDTALGLQKLIDGIQWVIDNGGHLLGGGSSTSASKRYQPGSYKAAATGFEGTVHSPTLFMTGEAGSEDVSIRPRGSGGSGGTQLHIHIDRGAYIDGPSIDRLANLILQRARYAPGV